MLPVLALLLLLVLNQMADASIHRSADDGRSWTRLAGAPPVGAVFDLVHLGDRTVAATDDGLWIADGEAQAWSSAGGDARGAVLALERDDAGRLWAAGEGGVLASDDRGA